MGATTTTSTRGARLAAAEEFVARRPDVDTLVARFVAAGREAADRATVERERQRARATRRLRRLLAGVAMLLVIALVAGVLALRQARRADNEAREAAALATRTDALRLAAEARQTAAIDRALLLAVEGIRLDRSPETAATLFEVLMRAPRLLGPAPADAFVTDAIGPDGRIIISPDARLLQVFEDERIVSRPAYPVTTSPRWTVGAQSAGDGPVDHPLLLYDAATTEPAAEQLGRVPRPAIVVSASFSADGRRLAAAFQVFADATDTEPKATPVKVWDLEAPSHPLAAFDPPGEQFHLTFSPDGRVLYLASTATADTWALAAYDPASGELIASSPDQDPDFDVSPDGTLLAVNGTNNRPVSLLDAATLAELEPLELRSAAFFNSPRFSPDGRLLAAGAADGPVYVWNVASRKVEMELLGHSGRVGVVHFSEDGTTLYSAGNVSLAWDLVGDRGVVRQTRGAAPEFGDWAAVPLDGGDRVLYLWGSRFSEDSGDTMRLLDVASGHLGDPIELGHRGYSLVTWRADQSAFASTGVDGFVRIWDADTGALINERQVADATVAGVWYTAGDTRLVVAEQSGTVYQIDAETLQQVGPRVDIGGEVDHAFARPSEPSGVVVSVDVLIVDLAEGRVVADLDPGFNPLWAESSADGRRLVVTGIGGETRLFDVEAGRWAGPPVVAHDNYSVHVAFSPDGATFVTGGVDGRLALFDATTGALLGSIRPGASDVPTAGAFVDDTHTVLVATGDGSLYTWDTDVEAWIDHACKLAGRNLTADEWREVFPDRPYRETCPAR